MNFDDIKSVYSHNDDVSFDGAIFDIDGTLWDAVDAVAISYSAASDSFGYGHRDFSREQIMRELGLPIKVIFSHLYPDVAESIRKSSATGTEADVRIDEVFTRMARGSVDEEYSYLKKHGARLYPLVKETLETLSSRLPLFIVSNCEKGYIEICVDKSGIAKYFTDWLCYGDTGTDKDQTIRLIADRHGLKRPVYIGDIRADAVSSARAGAGFIWASYGFGDVEESLYYRKINEFCELKNIIR